jgi:hypothetical protein
MSFDLLKQQLITMSAIKGDSISSMLYSFIVLMIVEQIFKFLPLLEAFMKKKLEKYFNDATLSIASSVGQNLNLSIVREKTSSIYFTRIYENNKSNEGNIQDLNTVGVYDRTDCLIELVTNLDKSKHVSFNMMFYVRHHEVIEINNKIMFQVKKFQDSDKGLTKLEFELFSYDLTLAELHDFVNKAVKENKMQKQNKLGSQLYYFNEIVKPLQTYNGTPLYDAAPKMIPFTMTKFFTNKNLNNVYGEAFKVVKDRVNFFMNNEDWYKYKGIPYTLGILVSGPPGSGKTSCIKAIANTTKRHIINISLNEFTTKTQLRNLFYDEKILVEKGNQFEQLTIPCDKKIYVIEDIDCLTDVVLDRALKEQKEKELREKRMREQKGLKVQEEEKKQDSTSEKLNLSFILNLFDGVLETPGRILIMSSNYPEKIDKALIRPGRIDVNIIFGYCSRETIEEIIVSNYDINLNELTKYDFAENEYTPAEISQILFNNIHNKEEGLKMLLKENIESTRKLYNIPKHVQVVETPELDIRDVDINVSPIESNSPKLETIEKTNSPSSKSDKKYSTIDELFLTGPEEPVLTKEEKRPSIFGSMQLL